MISQCLHLRYLLLGLSHSYCFIDFRFCCYLFFVCRIRRLIDFCFLSFRRFIDCRFCLSFLTTVGWILLIESKPFDFAVSTPSLFVAWSIDAFIIYCLIDFRFCCFSSSVAFGVWSISLFSFRRFINRCFVSSFLTTVGWILLIESKPFDFAVSTPALFVAWSIAFLAVVLHRLSLLLLSFLRLSH